MLVYLLFVAIVGAFASDPHESASALNTLLPNPELLPPQNLTTTLGWTLFKQCDSRWGGNRLGTCGLTVCQAGCAMSSVAMFLATKGANTNPGALNSWLSSNGGYAGGCNIVWASVNAFGKGSFVSIQRASEAEICAGLRAGHGIIANVNHGGHWVLLTGCKGGGVFYVNDPGFARSTYSLGEIVQEAVYH